MPFPKGFGLRPPRPEDAEPIVAMMNAETEAFIGVPIVGIDWVASMWTAPSADLEADFAVVHTDAGDLAAYLLVQGHPPYTEVFAVGVVALPYHGRGLGAAIVAETERRAGRLVDLAPPQRRVVVHAGALADEPRVSALLSEHGYVEARRLSQMQIDFEGPPTAPGAVPGIEIRPLVRGEERAVYTCLAEAFDDDWSEGFPSEEDWIHQHVDAIDSFQPELWWLAWAGSQLAGALIGIPRADENASLGYVGLLGVRRAFRGRGIAEALLCTSFVQFQGLGRGGVCLHVDTESITGATRLYERVGMTIHPRFATWEKELRPGVPAG
jgi:mycothiol synthase